MDSEIYFSLCGLQDFNADVILYDTFSLCGRALATRLDTPLVGHSACHLQEFLFNSWDPASPWHFGVPNPMAVLPQANHLFTNRMVRNTFFHALLLIDRGSRSSAGVDGR
jgi:hypothetical protein